MEILTKIMVFCLNIEQKTREFCHFARLLKVRKGAVLDLKLFRHDICDLRSGLESINVSQVLGTTKSRPHEHGRVSVLVR